MTTLLDHLETRPATAAAGTTTTPAQRAQAAAAYDAEARSLSAGKRILTSSTPPSAP